MGRQIVIQPDGKYAVWSTNNDDFVFTDCTREELIEIYSAEHRQALARVPADIDYLLTKLEAGGRPYYQFTMSWKEALAERERIHGHMPSFNPDPFTAAEEE